MRLPYFAHSSGTDPLDKAITAKTGSRVEAGRCRNSIVDRAFSSTKASAKSYVSDWESGSNGHNRKPEVLPGHVLIRQ
jgi:hypothetical protein